MKIKKWFKKHAKKLVAVTCGVFLAFCSIVAFLPHSAPVETKAEGREDSFVDDEVRFCRGGGAVLSHKIGSNNVVSNTLPLKVSFDDVYFYRETGFDGSWRFRDSLSVNQVGGSELYNYIYTSTTNIFSSSAYTTSPTDYVFVCELENVYISLQALNGLFDFVLNLSISGSNTLNPWDYVACREVFSFVNSGGGIYQNENVYLPQGSSLGSFEVSSFSGFNLDNIPILDNGYVYLEKYVFQVYLKSSLLGQSLRSSFSVSSACVLPGTVTAPRPQFVAQLLEDTLYLKNELVNAPQVGVVFRSVIENFFNIEIFPNFRLSYLIMLSIGVVLFGFALKFFLGG